ncbi:hypothetical protein LK533_02880 [Sphingomonas sp. PL-96]|uniref:hypothetical protein n=1 Tax=Sphingomonas sp. PL-96 TaxID=2887201 RepID=UPI001E57F53E|nr:hypothetical protein [Sphingomonas sp. PL-96]MCC2975618.1 hypothetical protein [Sphingomonas sp. PL-96]
MTARDLRWKAAGFALTATACGTGLVLDDARLSILLLPLALSGLPLMIHGKRVAQRLRAERRGHPYSAEAVHAARLRRRARPAAEAVPPIR